MNPLRFSSLTCLLLLGLLSACATRPTTPSAPPPAEPVPVEAVPAEPVPAESAVPPAAPDAIAQPPKPAAPVIKPAWSDERAGRQLLAALMPAKIPDRKGWTEDIFNAFTALKIPYMPEYFCAAIAVIEQESSWQADPVVPGLNRIVRAEILKRAERYGVPELLVDTALLKTSPNGKTYKERIDALRTERQMNELFEDMVSEAPALSRQLGITNPIRTGGPMQVSIDFASRHVGVWPYPYRRKGGIRREVFTRRGGVYFGIANLLHYPVSYPDMIYRFADYNAGRYSSRNAAFQEALAKLGDRRLNLDGDLLLYERGAASSRRSETESLLLRLSARLGLSPAEIRWDLLREKEPGFAQTVLYRRVFEHAEQQAGKALPRQRIPSIRLDSPKIKRKLTTRWFAERVEKRYEGCLLRHSGSASS